MSDCVTRRALSKTADTRNEIVNGNRGRQDPANKKLQEIAEKVVSRVMIYNPSISNYRWVHAPNQLYISPEHSVSSIHKDSIVCYPDDRVSYNYYQNKVKRLNIGFVKLEKKSARFANCIYSIWKRSMCWVR